MYNFILDASFFNNDKNYSLNFIFDNINNLMEIYYPKWNDTNNINNKISYSKKYEWWPSSTNSDAIKLLKWTDYDRDWNTFSNMYNAFNFDSDSDFSVITAEGPSDKANLTNRLITTNISITSTSFFHIHTYAGGHFIPRIPTPSIDLSANLDMWHDNDYVYFQWFLKVDSENFGLVSSFHCILNNFIFYNVMN